MDSRNDAIYMCIVFIKKVFFFIDNNYNVYISNINLHLLDGSAQIKQLLENNRTKYCKTTTQQRNTKCGTLT